MKKELESRRELIKVFKCLNGNIEPTCAIDHDCFISDLNGEDYVCLGVECKDNLAMPMVIVMKIEEKGIVDHSAYKVGIDKFSYAELFNIRKYLTKFGQVTINFFDNEI